MKKIYHAKVARLVLLVTIIFVLVAGTALFMGSSYVDKQLLQANVNMAIDIALLTKNNFEITDAEVAYMKSLTFNQMEVDDINMRLMNVGNNVKLNTEITNVYIISPLADDEIKYTTDAETAEFFGLDEGTKLDGIWLLNGIIGEDGKFVAKERDDVYRYTKLSEVQIEGMRVQEPFGEISGDAWGVFITGYVPIYTIEGSFVGLLGIDMDTDKYQSGAQSMVSVLFGVFSLISATMVGLFLYFYFKYIKAKEGQLYFEFYSRMSHDMRTPMNGILGLALLSRDEQDINVLHENFEQVEKAGTYMLELINDTLDVQKLDANRMKLDPKVRNGSEMLDSLVAMIKPEADKKGVRFEYKGNAELDCNVLVDELRIEQIFMNLASNAVKFTPKGGKVTFTVECIGKNDNIHHEKFTVSDTGIGMSKEFIHDHIYKPFSQEHNSVTTQYGGSGLGLSIVKNLVELMGGKIEVTSKPNEGTTFTIYLDFIETDEEAKPVDKPQKADYSLLQGKKILLCEDHPLNTEIAVKLLEKVGCEVTSTANGSECVELFTSAPQGTFDVILMDIRMPVMDGITATKTIRALHRKDANTIPIIAMTANAYAEDIDNCLNSGMNAHIVKPINPEIMYTTIINSLK